MIPNKPLILLAMLFATALSSNAQNYFDKPAKVPAVTKENIFPQGNLTVMNNKLIFAAMGNNKGIEWYSYDGNTLTHGPQANPGNVNGVSFSDYGSFTILNGVIYYMGANNQVGIEPFRWDGQAQPKLIKDITPGINGGSLSNFISTYGRVYFKAGKYLYEYDPATNTPTILNSSFDTLGALCGHNNKVYYSGDNVYQLDPATGITSTIYNGSAVNTISYGSNLYFITVNSWRHGSIVRYNGSNVAKIQGADTVEYSSARLSNEQYLLPMDGKLYFFKAGQLCYFDTSNMQVKPAPNLPRVEKQHSTYGTKLMLAHDNNIYYVDDTTLVRYNGTKADSMIAFDFWIHNMAVYNNDIYIIGGSYRANERSLYKLSTDMASVQEVAFDADISMYPNPAAGQTNIAIRLQQAQNLSVNITDISGKVVYSKQPALYSTGNTKIILPTAQLSPGNYIVTLQQTQGPVVWSGKLIHQ